MMTNDEARARVAIGAAHLDRKRPCWFNELDLGTLTIWQCGECVIGQIGKFLGLDWHGAVQSLTRDGELILLSDGGFYTDAGDSDLKDAYRPLQDAWIEAIADRRLSQEVTTLRTVVAVPESAVLVASRP